MGVGLVTVRAREKCMGKEKSAYGAKYLKKKKDTNL